LITGPELVSSSIALQRFKEDEPTSDIANFVIDIRDASGIFEIIFVPNQPPKGATGTTDGVTMGGSTIYGREIHYIISKGNYEIIRKHFAR
jgi:hypothetical protein